MASTGRHLNIWGKRWGNVGKTGFEDTYSNTPGDQLFLGSSNNYSYYDCPGSEISFTTTITGGIYLLRCDVQSYLTSTGGGNGINYCFRFNGTQVGGTNGSSSAAGDTWQRGGHGDSDHVGCFSINRMYVVQPGLTAGTTVTANVMAGHWGSAELYHNYPNYATYSDFYIEEFAPL